MADRPVLIVRTVNDPTLRTGPAQVRGVDLLRQPLPRRLVLRLADIRGGSIPLLTALLRAQHRGKGRPGSIAVELCPSAPTHRALLAGLFVLCDPAPSAVQAMRLVLATEPVTCRPGGAGSSWQQGHCRAALEAWARTTCRASGRRWAMAVLARIDKHWPRSRHEERAMARVAQLVATQLSTLRPPLAAFYGSVVKARHRATTPPASLTLAAHRAAGPAERRVIRALYSSCAAHVRYTSAQGQGPRLLRAVEKFHRAARRAAMGGLTGLALTIIRRIGPPRPSVEEAYRSLRRRALRGEPGSAWLAAGTCMRAVALEGWIPHSRSRALVRVLATREGRAPARTGLSRAELNRLFGVGRVPSAVLSSGTYGAHERVIEHTLVNRLRQAAQSRGSPSSRSILRELSLGLLGSTRAAEADEPRSPGAPDCLPWLYRNPARAESLLDTPGWRLPAAWCREAAVDMVCARIICGAPVERLDLRLLETSIRVESTWARRLIACMCLARQHLRTHGLAGAARALASAAGAYRSLRRIAHECGAQTLPQPLRDFEALCGRALAALDPARPAGPDPVTAVARLSPRLRGKQPAHPEGAIDILDALVALDSSLGSDSLSTHLAQELARMLGGRVLLHYTPGGYLQREEQVVHTLSTWTIRQLVAAEGLKVWRVRPRPEMWRPEQRRPRGLLRIPLGGGCAVIARGRRFRREEVKAARAVLRFFALRTTTPADVPVPRVPEPSGAPLMPTVAEGLIGRAPTWRRVLEQLQRVAPTGCSVVLHGETGTGKERVARALHACSPRAHRAFVAVNCGALAPELVASELFGHVRGAFTGAERSHEGLFVTAHQGTLFLDEVGDMPAAVQVALLRVLEEHQVTPVGSARSQPVDVRIVCATHRDLEQEVRAGRFREDLWHRLNVVTLELPPLRDRLEDLPLLALHILARMPGEPRLHPDATEVLARYRWPGNVRELENVLRAATLLSNSPVLGPDLLERLLDGRRAALAPPALPLPPRTAALLEALGERWYSTPELARKLGAPARTLNRDLAQLVEQGLVRVVGRARASRYRLHEARWRDSARFDGAHPTARRPSTSPRLAQ